LCQLVQQLANVPAEAAPSAGAKPQVSSNSELLAQHRQRALTLLRSAAAELAADLRARQLALADVAPALLTLANTGIPMPGFDSSTRFAADMLAPVTVAGVASEAAVLNTKTRPKRLRLLGSDGQHRMFLLKASCRSRVSCSTLRHATFASWVSRCRCPAKFAVVVHACMPSVGLPARCRAGRT
jgi:hypothetical protein